ncbi:hypothetical protein JCM10213_006927 [Rhodosporidiobolus nylandii]
MPTSAVPASSSNALPHSSSPSSPSSRLAVLFHPSCLDHRYIRNHDIGTIVERPERLRAVKVGVCGAFARLEEREAARGGERWVTQEQGTEEELGELLGKMSLAPGADEGGKGKGREVKGRGAPFDILETRAVLSLDDPALRLVHPAPNHTPNAVDDAAWLASFASSSSADPSSSPSRITRLSTSPSKSSPSSTSPSPPLSWPEQLTHLCRSTPTALLKAPSFSEIPPHLPQGDLYLSPGSEGAIFGALGAVCEGVDRLVGGEYGRAFVAVRPPGHHCGESNPQGFCFMNNVAVAAAHAHLQHGINRVVILDIDLHHGNGTQELVWRINAEAHRILTERAAAATKTPASSPRKSSPKKAAVSLPTKEDDPLRIMYGSLHDIWSYPCEDANPALVAAASLSLAGAHGQHISNVHLEPYESEEDFHARLYPRYREALLGRAEEFVRMTGKEGASTAEEEERTLVVISAGFDASPHEHPFMSRHSRSIPTSFYRRFALDCLSFASSVAGGKLLAVLEGGYSDLALASGAGALLTGLASPVPATARGDWAEQDEDKWWAEPELKELERACAPPSTQGKGKRSAAPPAPSEPWLARAAELFTLLDDSPPPAPLASRTRQARGREETPPPEPMQLRARKNRMDYASMESGGGGNSTAGVTPAGSPAAGTGGRRAVSGAAKGKKGGSVAAEQLASATLPPLPPPVPAAAGQGGGAPDGGAGGTTAPSLPKVKFTWKQGGFTGGGEPRM